MLEKLIHFFNYSLENWGLLRQTQEELRVQKCSCEISSTPLLLTHLKLKGILLFPRAGSRMIICGNISSRTLFPLPCFAKLSYVAWLRHRLDLKLAYLKSNHQELSNAVQTYPYWSTLTASKWPRVFAELEASKDLHEYPFFKSYRLHRFDALHTEYSETRDLTEGEGHRTNQNKRILCIIAHWYLTLRLFFSPICPRPFVR